MAYACGRFRRMSVSERLETVKRYHYCSNCLARNHAAKDCQSNGTCSSCHLRHHSLLHFGSSESEPASINSVPPEFTTASPISRPALTVPQVSVNASTSSGVHYVQQNRQVFILGTAMVNVIHLNKSYRARALIDPASEASFITENLRNRLKLPAQSSSAVISGVNSVSSHSAQQCSLIITSPCDKSRKLSTNALVLPRISGNLPSFPIDFSQVGHISVSPLADPNLFDCRPVDLLLGGDLYPSLLVEGTEYNILGSIIAQNTIFGWILTGPLHHLPQINVYTTNIQIGEKNMLGANIGPTDQFCQVNHHHTTRRASNGRYLSPHVFRGDSRNGTLKQFSRNQSSLLRKSGVKNKLNELIPEQGLMGAPLLVHPEPLIHPLPPGSANRIGKIKALSQPFCWRWKKECLHDLHKRYTWNKLQRNFEIHNKNLPPNTLRFGRMVKTYPGTNGHNRLTDIPNKLEILKRSISK